MPYTRRRSRRLGRAESSRSARQALGGRVVERLEGHSAERPGEQQIGQGGVARQHRAVEVRPDHPPADGAFAPVAVPDAGGDPAQGDRALPQRRPAAVVLEAGEDGKPVDPLGLGHDLPDRAGAGAPDGLDVEEAHAVVGVAVRSREGVPHHLEAGADRQHHGAVLHPCHEGAVVDERVCGAHLRPVLTPAQAVDVRLGQGLVRGGLEQHGVEAPPLRAPGQDQPVAAVAIGPEKIGVHHGHPQRSAHAGAPSSSWNAV